MNTLLIGGLFPADVSRKLLLCTCEQSGCNWVIPHLSCTLLPQSTNLLHEALMDFPCIHMTICPIHMWNYGPTVFTDCAADLRSKTSYLIYFKRFCKRLQNFQGRHLKTNFVFLLNGKKLWSLHRVAFIKSSFS